MAPAIVEVELVKCGQFCSSRRQCKSEVWRVSQSLKTFLPYLCYIIYINNSKVHFVGCVGGSRILQDIYSSSSSTSAFGLLEFGLYLQQVLELVGRPEEEGRGLSVAGDELPHGADLGRVQLVVEQRRLLQTAADADAIVQLNRRRACKFPFSLPC